MMDKALTVKSIAGYCMESALWRMVRDVASMMVESGPKRLNPDDIIIDTDKFKISDAATTCEEKDAVWYIGSTVSFISSGHEIFGGKGKAYQEKHPDVQLPVLCREHESLTPLVHECLYADESSRITLHNLQEKAKTGYAESISREKDRSARVCVDNGTEEYVSLNDLWPEEMVGNQGKN